MGTIGEPVSILDKSTNKWAPAKVIDRCQEPRSYKVETPQGGILRRNRSHLRPSATHDDNRRVTFEIDPEIPPTSHTPETVPQQPAKSDNDKMEATGKGSPVTGKMTKSGRTVRTPKRLD